MQVLKKMSRRDFSILVGNILDHFDMALYGFLAPVFAPLFFPGYDPVVQLILAYSLLTTSLFSRPFGAYLFGSLANTKGPSYGLSLSLFGVAITTILIGCLPTYASIGWLAPIFLLIVRTIKGIFASGENTIAKLYVLEDKTHDQALSVSYIYQSSTILGIILASFFVTLITHTDNPAHYWRYPFWLGGISAFVGIYLRKTYKEKNKKHAFFKGYNAQSLKLLWQERKGVLRVAATTSFSFLTYTIPFIFFNSFVPLISKFTYYEMMRLNTILLMFDMVLIPLLGRYTKLFNPRKLLMFVSVCLGISIIPLFYFLENASLWYITFVRTWIVVWGVVYLCPLSMWYLSQFKGQGKYLLVGMGNALGAATIGRMTTMTCLYLWHTTKLTYAPAIYISLVALLATYAVKSAKAGNHDSSSLPYTPC